MTDGAVDMLESLESPGGRILQPLMPGAGGDQYKTNSQPGNSFRESCEAASLPKTAAYRWTNMAYAPLAGTRARIPPARVAVAAGPRPGHTAKPPRLGPGRLLCFQQTS